MELNLVRLAMLAHIKSEIDSTLEFIEQVEADKELAEKNPAKHKQMLDDLTLAVNLYERYLNKLDKMSIKTVPIEFGRFHGNEENLDFQTSQKFRETYSKNLYN